MRVLLAFSIVGAVSAFAASAQEYPVFNGSDYKLVSTGVDGSALTTSGGFNFLCKTAETVDKDAFLLGACKWIGSGAEIEVVRKTAQDEWRALFSDEFEGQENLLAQAMKLHECSIDIGSTKEIPYFTLNEIALKMGLTDGATRFVESTIQKDILAAIGRMFLAGKVIYLNSGSVVQLKDCA